MQKIISMLQDMQNKIECEGKTERTILDKASCVCGDNEGQLQKVISDSSAAIQEYSAQVKAEVIDEERLSQEVANDKMHTELAKKYLETVTILRKNENREFLAQEKDLKLNIAKLEKLLPALKKSGSSLLRTLGLAAPRLQHFLKVNKYMSSDERATVLAFLDQSAQNPQSEGILSILQNMHDRMKRDLVQIQFEEQKSAASFNGLEATRSQEIKDAEVAITEKEKHLGAVALSSSALEDAKEKLANVQKFKADMKECAAKEKEMNQKAKMAPEERSLLPPLVPEKSISNVVVDYQGSRHNIIKWADDHHIDHSKVMIEDFSHGGHMLRGLAATKDIQKYEQILHIPSHLIIHSSTMPTQEGCRPLWEIADSAHSQQILNLVYEKHRGQDSKWYDVIKELPTLEDFRQYYPYALPDDLSREFQFIPIVDAHRFWRESNNALRMNASFFTPQCFSKLPSKDEFLWAECVISTRQFGFGRTGTGLVPLIDYVNAALEVGSEPNSVYHNQDGSFVLVATKSIKAGEEILDQYRADGTLADYFLDTWGVLPEPGHPSRNAVQKLSDTECYKALGIMRKYQREGKCEASAVVCTLVTLSGLHCQHIEYEL